MVVGQVVQRFVIEPIQEHRQVIGEIAHALTFDGNVGMMSPKERRDEAHLRLRQLAARLRATLWTVPRYEVFQRLRFVTPADRVTEASTDLVGWSNGLVLSGGDDIENGRRQRRIAKQLRIPDPN